MRDEDVAEAERIILECLVTAGRTLEIPVPVKLNLPERSPRSINDKHVTLSIKGDTVGDKRLGTRGVLSVPGGGCYGDRSRRQSPIVAADATDHRDQVNLIRHRLNPKDFNAVDLGVQRAIRARAGNLPDSSLTRRPVAGPQIAVPVEGETVVSGNVFGVCVCDARRAVVGAVGISRQSPDHAALLRIGNVYVFKAIESDARRAAASHCHIGGSTAVLRIGDGANLGDRGQKSSRRDVYAPDRTRTRIGWVRVDKRVVAVRKCPTGGVKIAVIVTSQSLDREWQK